MRSPFSQYSPAFCFRFGLAAVFATPSNPHGHPLVVGRRAADLALELTTRSVLSSLVVPSPDRALRVSGCAPPWIRAVELQRTLVISLGDCLVDDPTPTGEASVGGLGNRVARWADDL